MAARRKIIENIMLSIMMLIALAAIVSTNLIYLEQENKASKDRKVIKQNQKDLDVDVQKMNETMTLLSAKETAAKNRDIHIAGLLEEFEIKLNQLIKTGNKDTGLLVNLTRDDSIGLAEHRSQTQEFHKDILRELKAFKSNLTLS